MNMKIKQEKQIEELLEKDFGMDKEDLLYNEENTILNDITKNIKDKSKKNKKKRLLKQFYLE